MKISIQTKKQKEISDKFHAGYDDSDLATTLNWVKNIYILGKEYSDISAES